MIRRLHLACFALLIALGCVPAHGTSLGTVSGVVRDSSGVPQMGAQVELLRSDLTVIASVFTGSDGHFAISSIAPGRYALKAMGASFLPAMRENVHVRANTVVNLTLNTLYEVMQWLPSDPRAGNARQDDWTWTLRSAANRPLLRWLEDGPLVVVSDGTGTAPKLKARLMATGQEGSFGESGARITSAVENTPSNSRELLASVDFAPETNAGLESMLGFRQDLGMAGSVQSVAAFAVQPGVDDQGLDAAGLDEAAVRTWETLQLGDEFDGEVGSEQVLARFSANTPNTVLAALPFATLGWHDGNSTVRYRMATVLPNPDADDSHAQAWLPALSVRDGDLELERGLHQEIGWERHTENSGVAVMIFADKVNNPVLEAAGQFASGTAAQGTALVDSASGLIHTAGPDFSSEGMMASIERRLPGGNRLRLSYANGNALVLPAVSASSQPAALDQLIATVYPRRAQMYTLALSGTLDGSGTRWRASYRWQPDDTVTSVAPFAVEAIEPYLNLYVRQPLGLRHDGSGGLDLLLDVRNLLAQGYQPYLLSDGSLLIFAQQQRGFRGGLAFTF